MAQGPLPRVTAHSPACGASAARSSAQAMSGRAARMAAAQARTRSQRRRAKEVGAGMSEAGSGCSGGVRGRFKVCARAQKAWAVLGGGCHVADSQAGLRFAAHADSRPLTVKPYHPDGNSKAILIPASAGSDIKGFCRRQKKSLHVEEILGENL